MKSFRRHFLTGLLALVTPMVALGQTWDGGQPSLNWADANNWNPSGVPAAQADLVFEIDNANGQYTDINLGANRDVYRMMFAPGSSVQQPFSFINNQFNIVKTGQSLGSITNRDDQVQVFKQTINLNIANFQVTCTDAAGGIEFRGQLTDNNTTQTLRINTVGPITLNRAADGGALAGLTMIAGQFNLLCPTFAVDNYALQGTGGTLNINYAGGATLTIVQNNPTATLAAALIGNGNIVKRGAGMLTLSGNNSRTGYFDLWSGPLVLDYTTDNNSKISTSAPLYMGAEGRFRVCGGISH